MKVKIDTKQKMHVITIEEDKLTANMTENFSKTLCSYLIAPIQNVIINFNKVKEISQEASNLLISVQKSFYDEGYSMVFCEFQTRVQDFLAHHQLWKKMNITPTESEACDMVQMEEIERELL